MFKQGSPSMESLSSFESGEHRLAVFAYDFPHKKTQDFLLNLFTHGIRVHAVLAMQKTILNLPPSLRTKIRHQGLVHPQKISERIRAQYHVVAHNSQAIRELICHERLDIAVIAGARILKQPVIDAFPLGIINFHPGLIPQVRGLDALLWSIHDNVPLGVSAHLIDARVDAGTILLRKSIAIHMDDSVYDLSERLYETELELLIPAIDAALRGNGTPVVVDSKHNPPMRPELQREVLAQLSSYLMCHRSATARWLDYPSSLDFHHSGRIHDQTVELLTERAKQVA